jgi:hypothetical protein
MEKVQPAVKLEEKNHDAAVNLERELQKEKAALTGGAQQLQSAPPLSNAQTDKPSTFEKIDKLKEHLKKLVPHNNGEPTTFNAPFSRFSCGKALSCSFC